MLKRMLCNSFCKYSNNSSFFVVANIMLFYGNVYKAKQVILVLLHSTMFIAGGMEGGGGGTTLKGLSYRIPFYLLAKLMAIYTVRQAYDKNCFV